MKSIMISALFKECIEALGSSVMVLSIAESNKIFQVFEQSVPIYRGGSRIDWQQITIKTALNDPNNLALALQKLLHELLDTTVYVLWNDESLPIIKTDLASVVTNLDDVISVCPETWLFNPSQRYIVELYYLGDITAGLLPIKYNLLKPER
jgi:hypothetical protein